MSKYYYLFAISLVLLVPFSSLAYGLYSIPPTNAIAHIKTQNGTSNATNFDYTTIFEGLRGIKVFNDHSNHIYFNATLTNGSSSFTPITCSSNHALGKVDAGGIFTCYQINSTSGSTLDTMQNLTPSQASVYAGNNTNFNFRFKGLNFTGSLQGTNGTNIITIHGNIYQNNTGSNLGTLGTGIYSGMSGSILQFLKLLSANNLLSISSNSTNILFTIQNVITNAFKSNSITCAAGSFFSAFSNSTGTYTCTAGNSGTVKTSQNVGKATGSIGVLAQPTSTSINGRNLTGTSPISITKTNDTDIAVSCPTCITSAGVTQLNTFTGKVNITRQFGNTTMINSTGKITVGLGVNPLIINGANQTVVKGINFNKAAKITGLLLNATTKTSSYTATSTDDAIFVNATSGNFTVTLPSISIAGSGKIYTVEKIDSSTNWVEIIPTASTINQQSNLNLTNSGDVWQGQNNNGLWTSLETPINTPLDTPLKNSASNSWYGSWANQGTPTTLTLSNNTLYAIPFKLAHPTKISQIQEEVSSAGAGDVNCRMGIYNDNGKGYPNTLLANSDVSTFSGNNTGVFTKTFSSNKLLSAGLYYSVTNCNAGSFNTFDTISIDVIPTTVQSGVRVHTANQNLTLTIGTNANSVLYAVWEGFTDQTGDHNLSTLQNVHIGTNMFTKIVNSTSQIIPGLVFSNEVWYLVNPPTGSQTITFVPKAGLATADYTATVGAYSLYNVNQALPFGATVTNSSASAVNPVMVAITPTNTKAWLIDSVSSFSSSGSSPAVQSPSDTSSWVKLQSNQFGGASQRKTNPTINAVNKLTWTNNLAGTNKGWSDLGIEIVPSFSHTSGILPDLRSIPPSSLYPYLGQSSTMGSSNGNTMYTVTYSLGTPSGSVTALPYAFPSGATLSQTNVPEILVNVKG